MKFNWQQRRVLITGITGIVGSWLAKRLISEGAYVVGLVRDWDPQSEFIRSNDVRNATIVNGCLEDYNVLVRVINEQEIDSVFHLGAQTIVGTALRNPFLTFESNIRGTYNLLEACRVFPSLVKRVVVASSDKAYGEVAVLPYTEEMPPLGRHPYDVSKSCADLLAHSYSHTYGMPISVARCGNIYGGGDFNWSRIVPGTIRSILYNQHPILRSDGTFLRDYIYVKDVVEAYMLLCDQSDQDGVRGQAFNFSYGQPVSVIEITKTLLRLMNREDLEPVILNQAKAEIKDQHLDSSKAHRILKWAAHHNLDLGLDETIKWYRDYLGVPM